METSEFKQPQEPIYQKENRLSEQQIGNLLSAVGNSEAKAVTFLLMKRNCIYTMGDLHKEVISAQGNNPGWSMAFPVPFSYCEWSFAPIGLVAREVLDANLNTYGYIKTGFGNDKGVAFAGLLLDLSKKYPDYSLGEIFGSTRSAADEKEGQKKRSPAVVLKIIKELVKEELPIQEIDLVKALGESRSLIGRHLSILGRHNVIEYRTSEYGVTNALYKMRSQRSTDEPSPYRKYTQLTKSIYKILQDNPDKTWTVEELAKNIQEINKDSVMKKKMSGKNLKITISGVLSHLAKNGYLNTYPKSEINLTESQRSLLLDIVSTIDAFQNGDPLVIAKGKQAAAYFLSHPEEISKLMVKAKEKSSSASRNYKEETGQKIISIVKNNQGITPSEVRDILERECGKKLDISSVREIINQMVKAKLIQASRKKNIQRLTPAN